MTTDKKAHSVSAMDKAVALELGHLAKYAFRNMDMDAMEPDGESPPVPIKTKMIQTPIMLDGRRYCNNVVGIETTNEVYIDSNRGSVKFVDQRDLNDYLDRDADMVDATIAKVPNMSGTRVCVWLHNRLRVPGDEFRARHANLLGGLDEGLLRLIEEGRLDAYVIPFACMRNPRERDWFMRHHNLHQLVEKMRSYRLSSDENSGTYDQYENSTRMVYGMTGEKGDNSVKRVAIFFGSLPAKNSNDRGWIVTMYVATLQLNYAGLLLAHCDGDMERFFARNGIVFPDDAFKKDDEAAKRRERKANKTPRRRRRDEPAAAPDSEVEAEPDDKSEAKPDGEEDEARPNVGSGFGGFEGTEVDDQEEPEDPPAATGSN